MNYRRMMLAGSLLFLLAAANAAAEEDFRKISANPSDCGIRGERLAADLASFEASGGLSKAITPRSSDFIPVLGPLLAGGRVAKAARLRQFLDIYLKDCTEVYVSREKKLSEWNFEDFYVPRGSVQSVGTSFERTTYFEYTRQLSAELGASYSFVQAKVGGHFSTTFGKSVAVESNQAVQLSGDKCRNWRVVYYDTYADGFATDPFVAKHERLTFKAVLGPAVRAENLCESGKRR